MADQEENGQGQEQAYTGRNIRPTQKRPWEAGPRDAGKEKRLFGEQMTEGINFDKYDKIPVKTYGHEVPPPMNTFQESYLHEGIKWMLRELAHYNKPTPVQRYAIPISMCGRDLMACAQTGSGKTAAFLLPIISQLFYDGPEVSNVRGCATPRALVLAPTRELATQIHHEALKFTYRSFVRPVAIYGGGGRESFAQQEREMAQGCHMLIATTGRLIDFIEKGKISLEKCQYIVLDEADRMLDMGFEVDVRHIISGLNMPADHQTAMFSATFPKEIQMLAADFLIDYVFVTIGAVGTTSSDIKQVLVEVPRMQKRTALMKLLDNERQVAKASKDRYLVLIFVATKREAAALADILNGRGYGVISIHGDLSQQQREAALKAFKTGLKPILIATDVAQRGLDIPNVMHVIQYDLPNTVEDYTHRIGRTGRAGNLGKATSFWDSEKNGALRTGLIKKLAETKQEVPAFLTSSSSYGGGSSYGRGGSSLGRPAAAAAPITGPTGW